MSLGQAGYTLLEMVVVMAILAVATAVAAPPSYRMVQSWQEATRVDDVFQQLERLPSRVRATGTPLNTGAGESAPLLELPTDWQLHITQPLRVQANGVCSDARGSLVTAHQTINFQIQPPFCRVQRLEP